MRTTLIHNPTAGYDRRPAGGLVRTLEAAGYDVAYRSTQTPGWRAALEDPGEVVVVAGGDGTVSQVAARLAGTNVPIAILPIGTANNLATGLGVGGTVEELIASWARRRTCRVDVGIVEGPWGERHFIEGVGFGIFPQCMLHLASDREAAAFTSRRQELERDLHLFRTVLRAAKATPRRLLLDGEEVAGEGLLLEVMNLPFIGPNLCLAPRADPGDGLLDIVLLAEGERQQLDDHLEAHLEGNPRGADLPTRTARRVEIEWDGLLLHIDDEIMTGAPHGDRSHTLRIALVSSVEVLVDS